MSAQIPIGQLESSQLEFKAAAALSNLPSIAREVVAMLNATGGELWIGITEHDGIATSVDRVSNAAQRRIDLLNHLLDVIRPALSSEEVEIVVHRDPDAGDLLCLRIHPLRKGTPYYFRKDGGRFYVKRVDHRIRPMSDDEIGSLFGKSVDADSRRALQERRDSVLHQKQPRFWIGIQPIPNLRLDIQDKNLETLLLDPTKSGNRRSGWNFRFPLQDVRLEAGKLVLGDPSVRLVTIWKEGGIEFRQALERLRWNDRDRPEIYPLAFVEYVTSLMRLAEKVYGLPMAGDVERILFDLVMTGIDGWTLPAYDRDTHGYLLSMEGPPLAQVARPGRSQHADLTFDQPFTFPMTDLRANPDDVAFRVVREVFERFGLREEHIPRQFDRAKRRLILTD